MTKQTAQTKEVQNLEQEMKWRHSQIGQFFRGHRIAAGLDETAVARSLGIEEAAVIRAYENGEIGIPTDEIFGLSNILNIPPEDILSLIDRVYLKGLS